MKLNFWESNLQKKISINSTNTHFKIKAGSLLETLIERRDYHKK